MVVCEVVCMRSSSTMEYWLYALQNRKNEKDIVIEILLTTRVWTMPSIPRYHHVCCEI